MRECPVTPAQNRNPTAASTTAAWRSFMQGELAEAASAKSLATPHRVDGRIIRTVAGMVEKGRMDMRSACAEGFLGMTVARLCDGAPKGQRILAPVIFPEHRQDALAEIHEILRPEMTAIISDENMVVVDEQAPRAEYEQLLMWQGTALCLDATTAERAPGKEARARLRQHTLAREGRLDQLQVLNVHWKKRDRRDPDPRAAHQLIMPSSRHFFRYMAEAIDRFGGRKPERIAGAVRGRIAMDVLGA